MSTLAQQEKYPKLMAHIAALRSIYDIPEQTFWVGDHENKPGENTGSLAILGFAKQNRLNESDVLAMFGEASQEVLSNPDPSGTNHANIRAFLVHGLNEVQFGTGWNGMRLRSELQLIVDAFPERARFSPNDHPQEVKDAVEWALNALDQGIVRVAMNLGYDWVTNEPVKMAILLSFRLFGNEMMGNDPIRAYDKVRSKFAGWAKKDFDNLGSRVVPGAIVRRGAFIGPDEILMPSLVNIGAYVAGGGMIDTWATVGSCAQIGKNVHLSGGVGIGGVLEPVNANPVIIGDGAFIGARSEVVEGVIVEEGSVLSMGCLIGQSTPIVDRETGFITYGRIPAYSVVIPGNLPMESRFAGLTKYCVIIAKKVDAQTRSKVGINELLRGV